MGLHGMCVANLVSDWFHGVARSDRWFMRRHPSRKVESEIFGEVKGAIARFVTDGWTFPRTQISDHREGSSRSFGLLRRLVCDSRGERAGRRGRLAARVKRCPPRTHFEENTHEEGEGWGNGVRADADRDDAVAWDLGRSNTGL